MDDTISAAIESEHSLDVSGRPMRAKPEFFVVIDFHKDQADQYDLMHRVRNYGEDLWRAFRQEPRVAVDFDVIDDAWDCIHFKATSEILAKRSAEVAEGLLEKAHLTASITICDHLPTAEEKSSPSDSLSRKRRNSR